MIGRTHGHLIYSLQAKVQGLFQVNLIAVDLGSVLSNVAKGFDAHSEAPFTPNATYTSSYPLHHDVVHLHSILRVDRPSNERLVKHHFATWHSVGKDRLLTFSPECVTEPALKFQDSLEAL